MSEFICPICGSPNEQMAMSCQTCGVDFEQLPLDLKSGFMKDLQPIQPETTEAEEIVSDIPDWIRKRMKNTNEQQQAISFERYLPNLAPAQTEPKTDEDHDREPVPFTEDDLNAREISFETDADDSPVTAEEEPFVDFSINRPEQKWDADEIQQSLKAEKSFDAPEEPSSEIASDSEAEADFEDFSLFRPAEKWAAADDPSDGSQSKSTDEGALLLEDQPVLFDGTDGGDPFLLTSEEEPFYDFSTNRPAPKWDAEADNAPAEQPKSEKPTISQPTLLDTFFAKLSVASQDELIEKPEPPSEPENREPVPFRIQTDHDFDAEIAAILLDEAEQNMGTASAEQELESLDMVETIELPAPMPAKTFQESPIPAEILENEIYPENVAENENETDEIPWNLFESVPAPLPGMKQDSVWQPFAKAGLEEEGNVHDVQQRMIASILEKVFQMEGSNKPFGQLRTRKTSVLLRLIFSCLAIVGLIVILFTPVTDSIPLSAPDHAALPALASFEAAVHHLPENMSALIAIDFPSGFANELLPTLEQLVQQLSAKQIPMEFVTLKAETLLFLSHHAQLSKIQYLPGDVVAISTMLSENPKNNYSSVFLITSDFDTSRKWVEQLSLWSSKTPLYVIASAQLSSYLAPYKEAQAIDAMISAPLDKTLFVVSDFAEPIARRKLFALWFLILFVFILLIAGLIQRNPYRSILSDSEEEMIVEKQNSMSLDKNVAQEEA